MAEIRSLEDGKYKLSYKEENNASRVQLFGSSNGKLTYKAWYSHPTDDRSYYDLKKAMFAILHVQVLKERHLIKFL